MIPNEFKTVMYVLISVLVGFTFREPIFAGLDICFGGPSAQRGVGPFWRSLRVKIWGYLALSMYLTFFGVGARLLATPSLKSAIAHSGDVLRSTPYSSEPVEGLDDENVAATMRAALIIGIVSICLLRIIVCKHHGDLAWNTKYASLNLVSLSVFMFLNDTSFFRTLFDSVIRSDYPSIIWMIVFASGLAGVLTEFLLQRFPPVTGVTAR